MVLTILLGEANVILLFLQFEDKQRQGYCNLFQFRADCPIASYNDPQVVAVTSEGRRNESTSYVDLWSWWWKCFTESNDKLNVVFQVGVEIDIESIWKNHIVLFYRTELETGLVDLFLNIVSKGMVWPEGAEVFFSQWFVHEL